MARERIATHPTGRSNRWSVMATETLSGNRTITAAEVEAYQVIQFDPTAARDVTLPAEEGMGGAYFVLVNRADGNETITVKNDGGDTVATVEQNEAVLLLCDAAAWRSLVGANT